MAIRFVEAQLSATELPLESDGGYRRGSACDAPLIATLGGNGVGPRPDQPAKSLCLISKHRAREALDKFLETLPRQKVL
jgi:hypothetical protein